MQIPVNVNKEVIGAIIILLLIQAVMAVKVGVFDGALGDTDVYMWLNRVVELHESGDWDDHTIHRIDPPNGYEQHWTRPFDVLLYSGAWIGSAFTDFGSALHVWSVLISPALEILALLALFWAVLPLMKGSEFEVLGLLFVTQVGVVASFVAGRADHQILIILFFILVQGLGIRMLVVPYNRYLCYSAGLISSLAIWVSVESLLFALVIYLAHGLFWLLGEKGIARKLLHYSLSITLLLILFRFVEYGRARLLETVYDQISVVYIFLFCMLTLFWAFVNWYEKLRAGNYSIGARLGIALSGIALSVLLMEMYFPGFFSGPMGKVDELFRRVHLVKIKELQPVVAFHSLSVENWLRPMARFILWLGIIIPGVPVLLYLLWKRSGTRMAWSYIVIASMVYLPLAIREIRWVPYVAILMLPGYAWLVTTIMQSITKRVQGGMAGTLRILTLLTSVIIFTLPRLVVGENDEESHISKCPLINVSRFLDDSQGLGNRPRNILAFTDFGPELLYRTRHNVYSIPSHRYQPGFTDSYNAMTALEEEQALEIIRRRMIDLILVCPGGHENHFYTNDNKGMMFHQKLTDDKAPYWLKEIKLPADAAEYFRLYEVDIPSGAN